jgi:hypothetical protein
MIDHLYDSANLLHPSNKVAKELDIPMPDVTGISELTSVNIDGKLTHQNLLQTRRKHQHTEVPRPIQRVE